MTITEEELQRIVARAVKVALNEIHGSDEQTESSSPSTTEEKLIDKGTGAFQLNHAKPLAYSHGKYYGLGEKIGGFGFSVKKKK